MFVAWPVTDAARRRLDGREARRRVVVGDHEQARGDREADQRAEVDLRPARARAAAADPAQVVHHPRRHRQEEQRGEHAGQDQALIERALDVAGGRLDREGADDRRDDRHAAEHQRDRARPRPGCPAAEGEDAEQHHGDGRDRVGLEQVGGHAGAVADVVAHVVGDHRRVARIVLRDAGLDLADDVGADVGALGEDAAAEAGEDGDQRAAEAEADERVDGVLLVDVEEEREHAVVAGDAEQREAGDEHAGDRAAAEGDVERRADPAARRLGDAGVGPHGHVHADEAGGRPRPARRSGSRSPPRCSAAGSGRRRARRRRCRSSVYWRRR